jgi:hypothetical protein
MSYSLQPTVTVDTNYRSRNAPLDQEKAGGRYAADLIPQLPARAAGSVALHSPWMGSIGYVVDAIARGYEMTVPKWVRFSESG